jgi:aryl-alcohol dehydrogenase-like predicted oxidoreductase
MVTLPGTSLRVSSLCLGGNRLGAQLDQAASFALLNAFIDRGGNFIDTAHVYANWLPDVERSCSEKTIGRWLSARGAASHVVVATKIGHPPLGNPKLRRLDATSLRTDIEEALVNLGLPHLDLVYLHRDDPDRPADEILGALEEFRQAGLIRYYGASNWSAARLEVAQEVAHRHGWQGFSANQPEWSLAIRNSGSAPNDLFAMDRRMYEWHAHHNVAAIPYSTQAKGYFDKVLTGSLDEATARAYDNPTNRVMADLLNTLALRTSATPTQVALNILTRGQVPTVPVIGPRTVKQIESSFDSLSIEMCEDGLMRQLLEALWQDNRQAWSRCKPGLW